MHDAVGRPVFIQVSNERGLRYLKNYVLPERANLYSKRKDQTGAWLIRIGRSDHRGYHGHMVIVRCMTGDLLAEAEDYVRSRPGMKRRESTGHNNQPPPRA